MEGNHLIEKQRFALNHQNKRGPIKFESPFVYLPFSFPCPLTPYYPPFSLYFYLHFFPRSPLFPKSPSKIQPHDTRKRRVALIGGREMLAPDSRFDTYKLFKSRPRLFT
uniref:Uncharacterized protein n=1 Tax=Meloidogyne incognita TaxID=6306 RepID=A0A914LP27_MELIC